ncbi:MAG: hypothetical protein EA360_07455 [Balneolaceae bacterium]|nr:MAG: hypothetical protein EA360_07455 [Balneolaceae bacterium]
MRIRKRTLLLVILGLILLLAANRFYNWSLDHYDYYTIGVIPEVRERHIEGMKCISCHGYMQRDGFLVDRYKDVYKSPYNMAGTTDGEYLLVTGQESNSLFITRLSDYLLEKEIPVGKRPHSVVLSADNRTAYVSNQWSNTVSVIDMQSREETGIFETGGGPSGLAIDSNRNLLYVANTYTSDVSVLDLSSGREMRRLRAGNYPTGIGLSPDGKHVIVVSQRSHLTEHRAPPKTEVTLINAGTQRVRERRFFMESHIMERIDFTPEGDLAFTTLVKPKNLVPSVKIEHGWMMTFSLGVISPEDGMMIQLPLDEPNSYYADPFDVKVSPDGKKVFISHSGVDRISVLDLDQVRKVIADVREGVIIEPENDLLLSQRYVIERIETGANPKGLLLSADGETLFVAERLTDRISLYETQSYAKTGEIVVGQGNQNAFLRRGEQFFNNAAHTFQNQYSCYSCHPDNHEDGLTYDMAYYPGTDLSNVQTLRELSNTSPFKWNGRNTSIYMQCGMRFSTFITRTEVFSPDDLNALVGFMTSRIDHPPNMYRTENGELTPAQKRGKELFERTTTNSGKAIPLRDQCITCHPPPNFTDRLMHDVGTGTDKDSHQDFLTPHLNNIYESAPYLHDGRANTLEELWTVFNDEDEHGVANDMTKDQLNDLVEYLLSIGSAKYYQ